MVWKCVCGGDFTTLEHWIATGGKEETYPLKPCEPCKGTGEPTRADSDLATRCETCQGMGKVRKNERSK